MSGPRAVLPAKATLNPPTYNEGDLVYLSVGLDGTLRSTAGGGGGGPTADVNIAKVGNVATSLGQKVMASSWPVTIASDQSAIPVTQSGTWSTGRTWTLSSGTDSVAVSGTIAATQSGVWSTGRTWALGSGTDSVAAVQSGAWTVAATQSGAWNVNQTIGVAGFGKVTDGTNTATLPAAGAGLFHYITSIQCVRATSAAVTGSAVLTITSTNLPGNPAWTCGNALAIGAQVVDLDLNFAVPLKSSVANTATTIVMPAAGASVVERINVAYYVGA